MMSSSRLLSAFKSVLLVVDVQDRLLAAMDKADGLIRQVTTLVQACGRMGVPVVVSEQYPKGLGHTVDSVKGALPANAAVLEKTAFGCLGDEGLRSHLAAGGRKQVVVCGIEAHVCVSQTVHQLLEGGYEVYLVQDAVASRKKRDYKTALVRMTQAGAVPATVEMVLFELLADAKHERFKEIQALIK